MHQLMRHLAIVFSSLLLVSCATSGGSTAPAGITFLHMNDTYRIGTVESGTAGGFSRVVTAARELKAAGRDVHVLHGGDFLYPSLESQLWDGRQMIDALNFIDDIAPLYMVAGNHEFDRRTPEALINAVHASKFSWLGSNYSFATGDPETDRALESIKLVSSGGWTIGFFGLTLHADDGGNERDYVPTQKNYKAIAERMIAMLDEAGADAIVALTHLHMWQDVDIARLKSTYPRFVLVAGGHEHEPEYQPGSDVSAAVVKGASNARVAWRVDLEFNAAGLPVTRETRLPMDDSVELDPKYEILAARWRDRLLEKFPFLEAKVGEAAVPLDSREVTVRNAESNWANFIVDQMRGAFGEPSDLAIINGGTLRIDDFIGGDILFEDIGRTFGFSSYLRHTSISGAEFRQFMEAGYRGHGPSKGYFPQVSGFRICVDKSRNEFNRIVSLQVPVGDVWQEIDADRDYTLVLPDFLWRGGDGYRVPAGSPESLLGPELKYRVLDAILVAQAEGQAIGAPVDPANPRIKLLREGKEPCWQ